MASAVELVTAYVTLAASADDLAPSFARSFQKVEKAAGASGKRMGKALTTEVAKATQEDVDKARKAYERASEVVAATTATQAAKVEAARRKEEIAQAKVTEALAAAESAHEQASKKVSSVAAQQAAKVEDALRKEEIARTKVTEALAKYPAESSQVLQAQDQLASASRRVVEAHEQQETAVAAAAKELRDSERESSQVMQAQDRLALAAQKVTAAEKEQEAALEKATKKADEAGKALEDLEQDAKSVEKPFLGLGDRISAGLRGDFKTAFSGLTKSSKDAADDVADDFDEAGDDAGAGMLDGIKGSLLAGGAALGIGMSFGEAFQQGVERTMANAKLEAALGIDEASAKALGQKASGVYAEGWGDNITDVSDVTAAVYQYIGDGPDTEWIASTSIAMSDTFGTDPQENIKAVSQMMRTGMVDTPKEGFDILTKGYQAGVDKAGDFTDTLTEYGTQFRNLGIDGETSVGLMNQGLQNGARDADKVADAFKEFGIRSVDGSKTTAQAFEALGMDADDMAARIGKGGDSARDATQDVLDALRGVEDPAERAQIAVGLFGTQAEDLGGALWALDLDTAATDMGDFAGSTDRMKDALLDAQSPADRIGRFFSDLTGSLASGAMPLLDTFADIIINVGQFFVDNPAVFTILAAGLTAAGGAAYFASGAAKALFFSIASGIKSVPVIGWIIAGITLLVAALTWFFTKTELGQEIWAKVWGGIKNVISGIADWFTGTLVPIFQTVWGILFNGDFQGGSALEEDSPIVGALFTIREAALAVADWFMNTLLPILQAVWEGIATGAVWLWQNAIVPAWNGIMAAVRVVAEWIVNVAWPLIQQAWDAISSAAVWLWQEVLVPAWDGIMGAISAVVDWITGTAVPFLQAAWDAIATAATWLYENIIQPVWTAIKIAIAIVVTAVLLLVEAWVAFFTYVLAPMFRWLYDTVILPVWNAIKGAISAVVDWFQDTAWPIVQNVIGFLRMAFDQLKLFLGITWAFIKNNVINPVVSWFQNTVWPIFQAVIGFIQQRFDDFKTGLRIIWDFIKNTVINPVVTWFQNTVQPAFQVAVSFIKDRFEDFKNGLRIIWDFVKNNIINPVVDWFQDTVVSKFQTGLDALKNAFEKTKDAIGTAWDKLKEKVREPVSAVIKTVIKPVADTYDKVAGVVGAPKINFNPADYGFASGGILPGYSPGRDDYHFIDPQRGVSLGLAGGEPIMRPEFGRAVGKGWVDRMNLAARTGGVPAVRAAMGFKDGGVFPGGSYAAAGGAWDWLKSKAQGGKDWLSEAWDNINDFIADPAKGFKNVVDGLIGQAGIGTTQVAEMLKTTVSKIGTNMADKILGLSAADTGTGAAGGGGGGTGGSLSQTLALAKSMGLVLTSSGRRGARTAQNGLVSLHALGRAHDYAGAASKMMAFFNAVDARFRPTELLYSPAGARNLHRSGRRYRNTGATLANHYSHVHVGFAGGGVFSPLAGMKLSTGPIIQASDGLGSGWGSAVPGGIYDTGGTLKSGTFGLNLSGRDEVVLDPAKSAAYLAGEPVSARGGASGDVYTFGDIHGMSAEDVAAEIEKRRRKRLALRAR